MPTKQPVANPTSQPSSQPSRQPSRQPVSRPTSQPSLQPTGQPNRQPTKRPSSQPSRTPTLQPSLRPSSQPTRRPSSQPSLPPTSQPSRVPSRHPSAQPSKVPTKQPVANPTSQPSSQPSRQPSRQPVSRPTSQPSLQPTGQPNRQPTKRPSSQPSRTPTLQPSLRPSSQPTHRPSRRPTSQPSVKPSNYPRSFPTSAPSLQPSVQPTQRPSNIPSGQPSSQPTRRPSSQPSLPPTSQPSRVPSRHPSAQPSKVPTKQPVANPTSQPSSQPSRQPSRQPVSRPTSQPSLQPTGQPSRQPTHRPSSQPSLQPTSQPTRAPSRRPTSQPSRQPYGVPTGQPSRMPRSAPSGQPSAFPSVLPTSIPSISQQPTTPLSYWTSYNGSVFSGNQTSLSELGMSNDRAIMFADNQFWQFNVDGGLYATSDKILCAPAKYALTPTVIMLACAQNNGKSTTIYNLELNAPKIKTAWQETLALATVEAVTFNPNANTVCVVGVDANSMLAVVCGDPNIGKFSGYAQAVTGYTPVITSAASGMGYPGSVVGGYVMRSGAKAFFAAVFNETGGAVSALVMRGRTQFVNAVSVLPCAANVHCFENSLEVGGYSTSTQSIRAFITLLIGTYLNEDITFLCQENSQLTDGILSSTAGSVYPQAFAVGYTATPGTTRYNNVLLVKIFDDEALAVRICLQENQRVMNCKVKALGPGFLVWCLVQTQGVGELLTFYVDNMLSVQGLNALFTVVADVLFSTSGPLIWEGPAVKSVVWQPPIFTATPSVFPSRYPSLRPSIAPTKQPSVKPTFVPSWSQKPTTETNYPTLSQEPTVEPSPEPTELPTDMPTEVPSEATSLTPSELPSANPSVEPTPAPEASAVPSAGSTTHDPVPAPSSRKPIAHPTRQPTLEQTLAQNNSVNATSTEESKKGGGVPSWAGWTIGGAVCFLIVLACIASSDEGMEWLSSLCKSKTWEADPDNYHFPFMANAHEDQSEADHDSRSNESELSKSVRTECLIEHKDEEVKENFPETALINPDEASVEYLRDDESDHGFDEVANKKSDFSTLSKAINFSGVVHKSQVIIRISHSPLTLFGEVNAFGRDTFAEEKSIEKNEFDDDICNFV